MTEQTLNKDFVLKILNKIEETISRISNIIDGLRSFAKDGSKDPFLPFKIAQLVEDTCHFCNERFKSNGIDLTIEDFNHELMVEGNVIELSQVLLNILNNAFDAVKEINVDHKWVKISVVVKDAYVEIHVTDCGNGITDNIQDKIFQPFYTTKEIGKGTGLGLSISLGIVQKHAGSLKLNTQSAHTNFVISLPLTPRSNRV